jgi:site-specific recombinase XerD
LPVAKQLLNKYARHPKCLNQDLALPVQTNQKMNAYLKEIADICKVNKVLTFHLAWHTFATTVTLSNGVPIETVSRMLGHTKLKQTQHYAKVMNHKIGADMANLRQKLEKTVIKDESEEEALNVVIELVKKKAVQPAYNYVLL